MYVGWNVCVGDDAEAGAEDDGVQNKILLVLVLGFWLWMSDG